MTSQPDTSTSLRFLLREIEKFASWSNSGQELDAVLAKCRVMYPNHEADIKKRLERGNETKELWKSFYELGKNYGKNSPEAIDALNELKDCGKEKFVVDKAQKEIERGDQARDRKNDTEQRRKSGQPISSVKPPARPAPSQHRLPARQKTRSFQPVDTPDLHPLDIRGMQPSSEWTLLIDETGSVFDETAELLTTSDGPLGRIVGLLLPKEHDLTPLELSWHAVDMDIDSIDQAVNAILKANVGILGVTVNQLPKAPIERWTFGVQRIIDLVLRLLPIDDAPAKLTVLIEQRSEFIGGSEWKAIAHDSIYRLALSYPERGARIRCDIEIISKNGSPFNGYVDVLAFIWGSQAAHSRECLKLTGLKGTCFLQGDALLISRYWEWLDRGITLEGEDWATLLGQPEVSQKGSLADTILQRLGQASQTDSSLWQRYLGHTLGHLDSKAIDLKVLGRQVEWLERWSPAGKSLPPTARLLWLTAKLARANHLGKTEETWMQEMRDLGNALLDENAHLVCRAELNLAVNATNRYDFAVASQILDHWRTLPKGVPGLRYWAQVQSSLGQHAAFRGDNAAAILLFDEALAAFARLSNEVEATREARQTLAYRAIAMMDDPSQSDAEVRKAVEMVTGPASEAVAKLAASVADGDKYSHHLLLRWLVQRPDAAIRTAYIEQHPHWHADQGHPWPLIQLYRALLLQPDDAAEARKLAMQGFELATAEGQGSVLHLIGACCRVIAAAWGEPWQDAEAFLGKIEESLPLAQAKVATMRQFIVSPSDPLELLKTVLPFNFH